MPPSFGFTLALVGFLISNSLANIDPDVKIRIIPTIVSIPPPVTYLDKSRVSRQESLLTCKVWPPNANLSILSARPQFLSSPQLPFNLGPVPPDSFAVQEAVVADDPEAARPEPSPFSSVVAQLMVSDTSDVWHVDYMDLHCKAATQFGTVVSAPFRVVHARLDDFSMLEGHAVPSDYTNTQVREFIKGNMAFVTCPLPPDSQPPPTVQFYINGSLVNNTQKYKQVRRPNENSVLLLINSFKTSDEGDYRCSLTNPVTGRTVWSPMIVRLQIRVPDKPVPVRLLLPLVSQDNSSALQSRQIVVREGDNVTLLCIMEGAPPPEVRTYPHNQQSGRYIFDEQFGLLHIVNVQPSDEGSYLCTSSLGFVSTATLKVKARLQLKQSPTDVRVPFLGSRAEFRCSASDPSVAPFWLFNGKPVSTANPQLLVVASVKESDLGIYQCIIRSLMPDGRTDEWVSASAVLALQSDKLVTKATDLSALVANSHKTPEHQEQSIKEMTPRVEMALDNFAVYLTWTASDEALGEGFYGDAGASAHGLLQPPGAWGGQPMLPHPQPPQASADVHDGGGGGRGGQDVFYQIEYATLISQPVLNPALVGLVPPEPAVWSKTERLGTRWKHNYGFVIGPPLEPGKTYRFRVRAVSPNSGADAIPPSGWSDSVSTHHISNAPPPRITSVQPYHDGRFNVTWEYDGDGKNLKWANESASFEPFVPDFFLILVRPVLKNDAKPGDEGAGKADNVVKFGRYRATQVNGSDAKEGFIYNLNTSVSYQLVVYGVKYENGVRRITRFSEAKFATLPEVPGFGSFSLIRAVTENKPIFIGLGALALIIFIIIMILVVMCVARQRKDRRRRRAKHNGFVAGHSETDKYQSQQTNQRGDDLRPSSPSVKAAQGAAGQAMMMGTLMRQSNFSETDAQRFQQQQHQQQQQQQFAHQQMAMMDPSLHFGYYGQQPQPHHHQSHHSLLLSPTGGMASPMFHSSTLPGGPARYSGSTMRATPHPPPFGSQQVLNQGGGGGGGGGDQSEQAILMRDFYNQQYQQQRLYQQTLQQQVMGQQPFMYATNNPAAYLPPQHPGDTMSRRQSQGYPYGGSTHSGTSLKRDGLPTNGSGSMHEDATLLARSPMSPHVQMLNEPAGSPVSGLPPPGYFQQAGSQQALHMQGVGGAAGYPLSPSQQMSMYQQHQQSLMMAGSPQMGGVPFYPGQPPPPDPALMRHHSMGHHTDGESIYSYFSQQDVCHPQSHAHLNPLPEENHMNLGYTESGSQTAGLNGGGGGGGGTLTGNSVTGSPVGTGASGHRHHRRRRRKQQQQQQTPQQRQLGAGEGAEGMPSDGYQYGDQQQQQYPGYNDHMMMAMMDEQGQGRSYVVNGRPPNTLSGSPPSAAGLEQSMNGVGENSQIDNPRSGNQSFDQSTPSFGTSPAVGARPGGGPLPPPSQPPPPPPAPQMGGHQGGYFQPPPSQMMMMDSLNRRGGSLSGSGLLVGPPPRIRDYSEYGIPTGIPTNNGGGGGCTETPKPGMMMAMNAAPAPSVSNKQAQAQHQQQQAYNGGMVQSTPTSTRYREGQA